ncbi:MAG: hypothetical protein C4523_15550, partial [Myxococcales bacterium]
MTTLAALMTGSTRPLFMIGSGKSAGKTVALNRLRAEAYSAGGRPIGICSAGWDGEDRDHLTGEEKPRVRVHTGDVVYTASSLLSSSDARFEILWAGGSSSRLGRMAIAHCRRGGTVE